MNRLSRLAVSTLAALALSATAFAAAPVIEVVDAGENASQVLRYAPAVGSTETLTLVIDTKKGTDMGGDGKETDLPPFSFDLQGKVTSVDDDVIRYTLTVRDSKLLPQNNNIDVSAAKQAEIDKILALVKARLTGIQGATGEVEVSRQGVVLSSSFAAGPNGQGTQFNDLAKSLAISRVAFPSTPIGVGATWTVAETVMESSLKVHQTTTYRLKALDGQKATVASTIERKGDHESLQMKVPAGTVVTLAALASGGEGETVVELDHLFPVSGDLKDSLEARVAVNQQGKVMQLGNTELLELDIRRK